MSAAKVVPMAHDDDNSGQLHHHGEGDGRSLLGSSANQQASAGDLFTKTHKYSWDYCIVLHVPDGKTLPVAGQKVIAQLLAAGLEMKCSMVDAGFVHGGALLIKLRAPLDRIEIHADVINMKMLLDPERLEEVAKRGFPESGVLPFAIHHEPSIVKRSPYECIYGRYDTSLADYYQLAEGESHPFSTAIRLKVLASMVRSHTMQGGAGLSVFKLKQDGVVLAFFPLHDEDHVAELEMTWARRYLQMPWQQPLNKVKNYFGEKVGLYFCFLSHYTTWLLLPGLLGIIPFTIPSMRGPGLGYDNPITGVYGLLVSLWGIVMLEAWKRRQAEISVEWGSRGFKQDEQHRPEFKGTAMLSIVTGRTTLFFDEVKKRRAIVISVVGIATMVVAVIGVVAAIFFFRFFLQRQQGWGKWASTIASIANSIQITVTNVAYRQFALYLTELENPRTDSEFQDSLILKVFAFQFVNSYASLFYIAFIQRFVDHDCTPAPCIRALGENLIVILVTKVTLGNLLEVVAPWLLHRVKQLIHHDSSSSSSSSSRTKQQQRAAAELESQFHKQPYDDILDMMDDYAELAVQFGYASIFVVSYPLTPLVAFVSNLIEIKIDSFKLLRVLQRAVPVNAEDIGTWQSVFEFVAMVSVVSNTAIILFNTRAFANGTLSPVWMFVIIQYIVFGGMVIVQAHVPDESYDVRIQRERATWLTSKLIDRVVDEVEEAPVINIEAARDRVASHMPPGCELEASRPEEGVDGGALAMLKKAFTSKIGSPKAPGDTTTMMMTGTTTGGGKRHMNTTTTSGLATRTGSSSNSSSSSSDGGSGTSKSAMSSSSASFPPPATAAAGLEQGEGPTRPAPAPRQATQDSGVRFS